MSRPNALYFSDHCDRAGWSSNICKQKEISTSPRCTILKLTSYVGLKKLNNIITQIHSLGNEMEGLKTQ